MLEFKTTNLYTKLSKAKFNITDVNIPDNIIQKTPTFIEDYIINMYE